MDVDKTLQELYEEKKRLDRAIARLETRLAALSSAPVTKRGRKGMGETERLEVSRRMTAYWAARRARAASKREIQAKQKPEKIGNGVSA